MDQRTIPQRDLTGEIDAALVSLALSPTLYTREQVLARPSPVPNRSGLYAWHFRVAIAGVQGDSCHQSDAGRLLYLGISPSRSTSPQNLRRRIVTHYSGNAEGSTLRLTLGVLLGHELRRVGSGIRRTFTHAGEQELDAWMTTNALVAWHEHPEPWRIEHELLSRLACPLNIDGNAHHPFVVELRRLRAAARAHAAALPVADEGNQRRRAYR